MRNRYFTKAEYNAELAAKAREKNRLRLDPLIVEEGQEPPKSFVFEGIKLDYVGKTINKTVSITHHIYKSRSSGWRISFTDRDFAVGVDTKLSNKTRGILTIENYWRDRGN